MCSHTNKHDKEKKMAKYAVIVVDMLEDFVNGALACDRGKAIVPYVAKLCKEARAHGVPVIFSNDCHIKGVDKELQFWGDHAICGTPGAEVIKELELCEKDFVVPKRHYSGFFGTDLNILLKDLGVDTCVIAGLHAHMCCRHTGADAYQNGYDLCVPKQTTDSFTEEDYLMGLKYFKETYGADVCELDELLARF